MRGFDPRWPDAPHYIIGITRQIWEERHIGALRDRAAIVSQMGFDVVDWARDLIAREGGPDNCVAPLTPANDVVGPYDRQGNDNEWGTRYADTIRAIMAAEMDVIPRAYDRAVNLHYPGGQDGLGWRDDPMMSPRAAVRRSLHGKHAGWGRFGTPTGAEIYIMGISHAEFGPFAGNGAWGDPTIRREYTLIDDTAIWKQIHLQIGAHP